ncbi:MAG: DNA polymerase III subunit alpha [Alphaproteobacteria bacterium]|nr:MAG: DNA polymerase III subunit alpha [Alphaproteobacteria bacterium]
MTQNIKKQFVHLNVHTPYSLCEGAISIPKIVKTCKNKGMPAVALTDTHNLFGALEFSLACMKENIQAIIGCKIFLDHDRTLILLCTSETGYQNLMKLVSDSYLSEESYKIIPEDILKEHHEGLIAIGCPKTISLKDTFENRFYISISRYGKNAVDEDERVDLAYEHNIPLVAINEVFFGAPEDYDAHDALLCIGEGRYLIEDDRPRVTPHHYFKSTDEMEHAFQDIPEALENTVIIAQRCQFLLKSNEPMLPPYQTETSEEEYLKKQAYEGLKKRLEGMSEEGQTPYFERLETELGIINKMGFPGYFLIVSDFIKWAKSQNIPVGPGRGSGAGSVVAWALTITNVDPIKYNLLFERFLNPERVSLPDFDVDFCQYRRDEVIEYVKDKYGTDKVAQICTFGSLQAKGVLRDVTRVLQMSYIRTDEICKMIPNFTTLEEALEQDEKLKERVEGDEQLKHIFKIGMQLEGLYRHVSTHAAGIVIGGKSLSSITPLYQEEDTTMPATQFSMKYAELAGLVKFDFLGLKTLTVIQHCCDKVGININDIPIDDRKTFELLAQPQKVGGIFQLESHGMRDVLSKLKPDRFEDLIALVALYRPGPMDDIPNYLERKHGTQEITYLHPSLEPILKETYGVMVYQEQVMHIAQKLANYSLGEADLLRRAMGKKILSEMEKQEKIFIEGAIANGIPEDTATQIFALMAKFASYGFNKSHSAPYALIAYQTAYLKANYPEEFIASLMTLDGDNTDKLKSHFSEFTAFQIALKPPCVNNSFDEFTAQAKSVRYGLKAIKNVGEAFIEKIIHERSKNGPFKSLADFLTRIPKSDLNKRQFQSLALSGAFDVLHSNRKEIFDNVEKLLGWADSVQADKKSTQQTLFSDEITTQNIEFLKNTTPDYTLEERLDKEESVLGFYLSDHPLSPYEPFLDYLGLSDTRKLGVVKNVFERVSQKGNKYAFVELLAYKKTFEVLVFKEKLELFRPLLKEKNILIVDVQKSKDTLFVNDVMLAKDEIDQLPFTVESSIDEINALLPTIENEGPTHTELTTHFKNKKIKLSIPNTKVPLNQRTPRTTPTQD